MNEPTPFRPFLSPAGTPDFGRGRLVTPLRSAASVEPAQAPDRRRAPWFGVAIVAVAVFAGCGEVSSQVIDAAANADATAIDGGPELDASIDAAVDAPLGECTPGAQRCSTNTPQVCGEDRMWQGTVACSQQTCLAGTCQGVCAPGQRACTTTTSSQCDATGAWAVTPLSEPRWTRTFGSTADEALGLRGALAASTDGNYLLAGRRGPDTSGDLLLQKFGPTGAPVWSQTYGTGNDGGSAVMATTDGAITCGTVTPGSLGCTAGRICAACVRVDAAGTTMWQRAWAGSNNDFAGGNAMVPTPTGFILAGFSTQGDSWMDLASTPVDLQGTVGTLRTFNRDGEDQPLDVQRAADGTLIAVGYTGGWRSCQQPWMARYNEAGTQLLSSYLAGPCVTEAPGVYNEQRALAYAVVPLADGSAVMVGRQWDGANRFQGFISKVTPSGTPVQQWRRLHGGTGDEIFQAITLLPDGGFLITGSSTSAAAGGTDLLLLRTDANGATQWSRNYGGVGDDSGQSILRAADGSYLVAGTTGSSGAGGRDLWVLNVPAVCQ